VTEPLLIGLGAAVAAGYVVAVDPDGGAGLYPACPFLAMTGHPCPLCGGLRTVHALGRGDLAGALSSNLLVVVLLVLAVLGWIRWLLARATDRPGRAVPLWVYWSSAVALVGFGVVRNLPFGAWLSP
jgi:hypothetical protein